MLRSLSAITLLAAACADSGTTMTARTPRDAGSTPRGDSGAPPTGGDSGGGTGCESDVVSTPAPGACAAATRTCLDACMDEDCADRCFQTDPNGMACSDCLADSYTACANGRGCQAAWDAAGCCMEDCADPMSPACEQSCRAELDASDACAAMHEAACGAAGAACFAS